MRRGVLPYLPLALFACAALGPPHGAHAAGRAPMKASPELSLLRLIGQDALDQPLLPQPGDIWADVLPTQHAIPPAPAPASAHRAESRTVVEPSVPHPAARARLQPAAGDDGMQGKAAGHEAAAARGEAASPVVAVTQSRAKEPAKPPAGDDAVRARARLDTGDRPTVQLAAAASAARAVAAWGRLRHDAPGLTDGHEPAVSSAEVNGREVWRLRAGGFADLAAARAFCSGIRVAKADCWVVPATAMR